MIINGISFDVGDIISAQMNNYRPNTYQVASIESDAVILRAYGDTETDLRTEYRILRAECYSEDDLSFFDSFTEDDYLTIEADKEWFDKRKIKKIMKENYFEITRKDNNRRIREVICSRMKSDADSYAYFSGMIAKNKYQDAHVYKINDDRLSFLRRNGMVLSYIYEGTKL